MRVVDDPNRLTANPDFHILFTFAPSTIPFAASEPTSESPNMRSCILSKMVKATRNRTK